MRRILYLYLLGGSVLVGLLLEATQPGNRCELVGYPGEGHGFFNYARGDGSAHIDIVRRMDKFLASLGWVRGEPAIDS